MKYPKLFITLLVIICFGSMCVMSTSHKNNSVTQTAKPAPPELPGKLFLLFENRDVTVYLFEFEGKRYVYTIGGTYSHQTATMVEHKSP